jgi:hypothetical protein
MIKIPLTQGQFALIDNQDYWLVKQFKWCAAHEHGLWYAKTRIGAAMPRMHQLLAGFPPFALDHKNGDGLDNRRRNLRPATPSQNGANKKLSTNNMSGYKGVVWHKLCKKWCAFIKIKGAQLHLGVFTCKKDAARAYADAAKKHFGKFARVA